MNENSTQGNAPIPRTVFRVRTPAGVWADGEWERREDVPEKVADRFNYYFETAEYIEEVMR